MQHCIPSCVTYLCDKFETKIFQLIRKTIQHFAGLSQVKLHRKLLGPEYNDLYGEYVYLSIKRLEQSIFNEPYSAAAHPCARAFRHNFQISNFTSAFIFTLVQNMEAIQMLDVSTRLITICLLQAYATKSMFRFGQNADKGMSYDKQY